MHYFSVPCQPEALRFFHLLLMVQGRSSITSGSYNLNIKFAQQNYYTVGNITGAPMQTPEFCRRTITNSKNKAKEKESMKRRLNEQLPTST